MGEQEKEHPSIHVMDSAPYVVIPISDRKRRLKSLVIFGIGLFVCGFFWWHQYKSETLASSWWFPLIILVFATFHAHRVFTTYAVKSLASIDVEISLHDRVKRAGLIALGTTALCSIAWVTQYFHDQLGDCWWWVWPAAIPGYAMSLIFLLNATESRLTESAAIEEAKTKQENAIANAEKIRANAINEERWQVRYGLATIFVLGAILVHYLRPDSIFLPAVSLIAAAFKARELSFIILGLGACYLAYLGAASLPVSVAIVLGALIIAFSIRKN